MKIRIDENFMFNKIKSLLGNGNNEEKEPEYVYKPHNDPEQCKMENKDFTKWLMANYDMNVIRLKMQTLANLMKSDNNLKSKIAIAKSILDRAEQYLKSEGVVSENKIDRIIGRLLNEEYKRGR